MNAKRQDHSGFITCHDLLEACHNLVIRAETLQSRRLAFSIDGEQQSLRITRPLDPVLLPPDVVQSLPEEPLDWEDVDDLAIYNECVKQPIPSVEYHVIHSTSYQVPVLYFFLHNLPTQVPQNIDAVYEYIVPKLHHEALRGLGVLGGIGMINHPYSEIPCWWVHPCRTAEAMGEIIRGLKKPFTADDYLVMWIGLVGSAVGLNLPIEMAIKDGQEPIHP